MKILFDIDDTLAETSKIWVPLIKQKFKRDGKSINFGNKCYGILDGLSNEERDSYLKEMYEDIDWSKLDVVDKSIDCINNLLLSNFEITFVTARIPYPKVVSETQQWVDKYFPSINNIIYEYKQPYLIEGDILVDNSKKRLTEFKDYFKHLIWYKGTCPEYIKTKCKRILQLNNYEDIENAIYYLSTI